MTSEAIQQAVRMIEQEQDTNVKQLLLAALVSELFREKGFEPVIVGGSAIEFYTDGAYMSGDVDICWAGTREPTPVQRAEAMGAIPGIKSIGTRTWKVQDLFIDLLGEVTRHGDGPFNTIETPIGEVVVLSIEELLAERVFSARCWTGPNANDEDCARKLIRSILIGELPCDWNSVIKIAGMPAYQCSDEVRKMKAEVEAEMASSSN